MSLTPEFYAKLVYCIQQVKSYAEGAFCCSVYMHPIWKSEAPAGIMGLEVKTVEGENVVQYLFLSLMLLPDFECNMMTQVACTWLLLMT